MQSFRWRSVSILILLPLLVLSLFATGGWPNAAAQSGTQVVPDCDPTQLLCNTYEFGGGWATDPDATMSGAGGLFALTHQVLANTSFRYIESPWVPNHISDNEALIQQFALAILSQTGQTSLAPVSTGSLADGSLWNLYAAPIEGVTYGMLFTADTADPSQNDILTVLTSPASTFDQALAAVQSDIRVNGVSPLAGIDPAQVMTALGGGGAVTPATGITSTPGTTPTLPPAPTVASGQVGQSVTVGADTVTYAGNWQYDVDDSAATIATFQNSLDPRIIFSYAQGTDRMSGGNPQAALDILDAPNAFGAQNAQQVAGEMLPSGRAYALYTWEREGAAEVALFVIDVTTTPGTLRAQILFVSPDQFVESLSSVQQSFQINGETAFSELDPSTLAGLLGGATPVTPTAPTTPVTGPTPTSTAGGGFTESPRGRLTPIPATTPAPNVTPTTSAGNAPVTVAGATITYAGTWIYDNVNSTPGEIAFFDNEALTAGFFGYQSIADVGEDPLAALHQFNESYLAGLAPTDYQLITEQTLPSGQIWALYTMDLMGTSYVVLTYAEATTTPGQIARQQIFTQPAEFNATLTDAQRSIQINGAAAFSGLDPGTVAALLEGLPAQSNAGITATPAS